jgi:hypothetical protein
MGLLARNRLDSALAILQLQGNADTIRSQLAQGHNFMSGFAVDSAKLVGWNVVKMEDTRGTLTYEAQGRAGWALLTVNLIRSDSSSRITGFHWQPMAARLADQNAFSLRGRSVAHYLYLFLALLSLTACVGGAVFAGIRRMGIPWILICLIGVGKATINWTTGQQAFNPVSFQLLGAGYFRPGFVGPWLVSWSLPLGTILMLIRLRRRGASKPPTEPSVAA